jgi:hypothetical protein
MRAWIELPADSGWSDARLAITGLARLDYTAEERRGAGWVMLRISGARLDRPALWRLPGQR